MLYIGKCWINKVTYPTCYMALLVLPVGSADVDTAHAGFSARPGLMQNTDIRFPKLPDPLGTTRPREGKNT
jgi:hypothetical protein